MRAAPTESHPCPESRGLSCQIESEIGGGVGILVDADQKGLFPDKFVGAGPLFFAGPPAHPTGRRMPAGAVPLHRFPVRADRCDAAYFSGAGLLDGGGAVSALVSTYAA